MRRAPHSKAGQVEALVDLARDKGLTIYEIVVGKGFMRVVTQPPVNHNSPAAGEDAADRWLREQLDGDGT